MNHLNRQEQELILDFYFRCGDVADISRGRDLIASNPEASKLYAGLEETLTDLDHIKYEPCPDNLVDLTIARLKLAASVTQKHNNSRLHDLLQQEQQISIPEATVEQSVSTPAEETAPRPNIKLQLHHRIGEFFATAAAILIILGILFPSAGFMRQHYYKTACADNLRQVGQGFASFAGDHNNQLAQPAVQAGSPWWKVGYQGPESHSNTRVPWQLAKQGYVNAKVFVCRGNRGSVAIEYDPAKMNALLDFPNRNNINYSFVLFCDKNANQQKVLAGDQNPIFRQIPCEESIYAKLNEFQKVSLNDQLRQMLSASHRSRGQNILNNDGSVGWIRVRTVNGDDIYTIQGVDTYTGKETPTDLSDIFLIP